MVRRVLSIQSHVVHGYVGNKVATFVLQLREFEVDPITTVHLSNHTGYPKFAGGRLSPQEFRAILTRTESLICIWASRMC